MLPKQSENPSLELTSAHQHARWTLQQITDSSPEALLDYLLETNAEPSEVREGLVYRQYQKQPFILGILQENSAPHTKKIVDILSLLINKCPQEAIQLLKLRGNKNYTIGHWITAKQGLSVQQRFISLLGQLSMTHPQEVLGILNQQNKYGNTLGHWIAYKYVSPLKRWIEYRKNPGSIQSFLSLLDLLSTHDSKEMLMILGKQGEDGNTIGHLVLTQHPNPRIFTNMLINLATKHPKEMMDLLEMQGYDKNTIGHLIVGDRDTKPIQKIIGMLIQHPKINTKQMVEIIMKQNADQHNLGHLIAFFHDRTLNQAFMTILSELVKQLPERISIFIADQNKFSTSYGKLIVTQQPTSLVLELTSIIDKTNDTILQRSFVDLCHGWQKTRKIFKHLSKLEPDERLHYIQLSLKPGSTLNKLFMQSTSEEIDFNTKNRLQKLTSAKPLSYIQQLIQMETQLLGEDEQLVRPARFKLFSRSAPPRPLLEDSEENRSRYG